MASNYATKKGVKIGVFLIIITFLLITLNTAFFIIHRNQRLHLIHVTDSLTHRADTASARFEIGYAAISLSRYQKMRSEGMQIGHDLLTYPIITNEIDQLIQSNNLFPAILGKKSSDVWLKDFPGLYRRKKLLLRETDVICLIIKQIGQGTANNVRINLSYIKVQETTFMYDPTDIGTDDNSPSWKGVPYKESKQLLNLGKMTTGASWLVPLYIDHYYDRTDGISSDPNQWSVTGGPLFVPLTLQYEQKDKIFKTIILKDVLSRPITIS